MKPVITFLLILTVYAVIFSCKKLNEVPIINNSSKDTSFVGNWSIVNDYTDTQFWGLWAGLQPTGTNYAGKATDYYNFLPNGTLYTSENNYSDTFTYVKMKLDTIEFTYLNPGLFNPIQYIVSNHTEHTMTLTNAYPFISPETNITHTINLKK
jgi:hypothetical protein